MQEENLEDLRELVLKAFLAWEESVSHESIDDAVAKFRERLLSTSAKTRAEECTKIFLGHLEAVALGEPN